MPSLGWCAEEALFHILSYSFYHLSTVLFQEDFNNRSCDLPLCRPPNDFLFKNLSAGNECSWPGCWSRCNILCRRTLTCIPSMQPLCSYIPVRYPLLCSTSSSYPQNFDVLNNNVIRNIIMYQLLDKYCGTHRKPRWGKHACVVSMHVSFGGIIIGEHTMIPCFSKWNSIGLSSRVGPLWVSIGYFAYNFKTFFPLLVHPQRRCVNWNGKKPILIHWGPSSS